MLWDAGQDRVLREGRERLAEQFVSAKDAAIHALIASGQVKVRGAWKPPSYLHGELELEPVRSPAVRDMALAQLGVMYPGMVRTDQ